MKNKKTGEQGISSYELFISALSVLSILNLVLLILPISGQVKQLILIVDVALTVIFLSDFTVRFVSAPAKRRYFFRGGGWLDLIGSLPTLRIFRLFRVLRVSRLIRRYGLRNVLRELVRDPAQGGLLLAAFFAIVTLEFGCMLAGITPGNRVRLRPSLRAATSSAATTSSAPVGHISTSLHQSTCTGSQLGA